MLPIIDYKTGPDNKKYDFSLMGLTETDVKIIFHALEIYYESQKEFLKSWEHNCKTHPNIAENISEVCFNEVAYTQFCINESQKLQNIIAAVCKNF